FSDHPITNSPDSLNLVMLSEVRRRARLRTKSKHPDAASSAHAESGHSHETVSGFVILSEVRRSNATEDEVEGSMHVPLRSSWFCNLDCATCPGSPWILPFLAFSRAFSDHPITNSPDSLNLVMLSEVRRRVRLRTKSKHPDAASSAHAESGHSHETVSGLSS